MMYLLVLYSQSPNKQAKPSNNMSAIFKIPQLKKQKVKPASTTSSKSSCRQTQPKAEYTPQISVKALYRALI
jgi:hypothetical protein